MKSINFIIIVLILLTASSCFKRVVVMKQFHQYDFFLIKLRDDVNVSVSSACADERRFIGMFVDSLVIKYINRLSDFLFVLARYTGHQLGVEELPWKPRV